MTYLNVDLQPVGDLLSEVLYGRHGELGGVAVTVRGVGLSGKHVARQGSNINTHHTHTAHTYTHSQHAQACKIPYI